MELKSLRFLYEKENVVLLGPPGVGKTHLAVALGMEALREGKKVYFVNAISLVDKLKKAFAERRFEKAIGYFKSIELLIVDELGYLPLENEGAKLFFELVSEKYEKGSIVLTSNRGFAEWNRIFEDEILATAVLDRLLHHCTIVNIRGKSYRLREKQKTGLIGTQLISSSGH
ncbi:MAG: ATP-binding protein, partial [Thermotogaceae bacterium]|nr:ATP-binding protein [Thermotogaceae bacterium]